MKHVYKILPVSAYDIPGLEQWLEEQARAGLFPVHLGAYASFRRDGVPGARFRLDPFGRAGPEPSEEQRELYQTAGWEYVLSMSPGFYLFSTADPAAPELHTDPVTQGLSLDRLSRQIKRSQRLSVIYPALLLLLIAAVVFLVPPSRFDVQPDRWANLPFLMLAFFNPVLLLSMAVLAFLNWKALRDTRCLLTLHQQLKEGLPPPPSPGPSRAVARRNRITLFLGVAVLILFAGTLLSKLSIGPFAREIPLERFSQPYVALNSLETEPVVPWEELYPEDAAPNRDENTAQRFLSLLAPVWYDVSQHGYSLQPDFYVNTYSPAPENDRQRYSPSLDMTYVRLTFPGMSQMMARSLLDGMRLVNCYWTYEQVDYPGADLVILAREETQVWQMAALVRGGQVAVFRYAGREDLASHLDDLAQVFH